MQEEDTLHELFRLLKSRFFSFNKGKRRKNRIEYKLKFSKYPKAEGGIRIGVVSDIEGAVDNARRSAQKLKSEKPDIIVIAGDCYESSNIRSVPMFPDDRDKHRQMRRGIEPYAKLDVPILVIPGNHEDMKTYSRVMRHLSGRFPKVRDMHRKTYITKDVSMIFLGGYHNPMMTEPEGFMIDENDYEWLHKRLKVLKKKEKPIILVSHGPPMSTGMLDFLPFFGNVGDEVLSDIISSFKGDLVNLHGHIHEKTGEHYTFKNTIAINASAVTNFSNPRPPNTSIVEVSEGKIVYREI